MATTLNDKVLEAYYATIGEAHLANIVEELEANKEEIEQIKVPESLTDWLETFVTGLIKREKKEARKRQSRKYASRAAVVLLMITLTGTILTFSVEAIRIRVFNMLLTATDTYTEIRFDEEVTSHVSESTRPNFVFDEKVAGHYYPTYIPEGYVLKESNDYGTMTNYRFEDEAGRTLYFDQSSLSGGMQIDTEDALVTHPVIDGDPAIMAEEDGQVILVWHNAEYAFTLIGEMTGEEALKIAHSIEKE